MAGRRLPSLRRDGRANVGRGHQHGGERVGRPAPGSQLSGMSRYEGESDPAVVQEDPRRAGDEMRPEVEGVGLGQRDAEPVGVDGTQVGGVPVADAGNADTGAPTTGATSGGAARSDGRCRGVGEPLLVEERRPSAPS